MAFKRKQETSRPVPPPKPDTGDTLARIEAVTDRLEWLAAQIEKQLKERDGKSSG